MRENGQPLLVMLTPLRKLVVLSANLSSLVSYVRKIILLTSALLSQRCEERSETQEFPSPNQPIVSQQSTQPLVDQVVEPISALVDPTLLLESDPNVIEPTSSLVNPTLPLESNFHGVVESIPFFINPTFPLESEVSASHIFFTTSSELAEQGSTEITSNQPPPSSRISSFDWDSLVEWRLLSDAPFQIKVKVESYMIDHCIVDEGASVSILSTRAWRGMGSPTLC